MTQGALGRTYEDGEAIVEEGDTGNCMYVIQQGEVEVSRDSGGDSIRLAVLASGDFFGEMALFDREVRSATVRSRGLSRILTVDKRTLLRRISEDPSLAFRILRTMSRRIRELDAELADARRPRS